VATEKAQEFPRQSGGQKGLRVRGWVGGKRKQREGSSLSGWAALPFYFPSQLKYLWLSLVTV
jgi:hypothetical protein